MIRQFPPNHFRAPRSPPKHRTKIEHFACNSILVLYCVRKVLFRAWVATGLKSTTIGGDMFHLTQTTNFNEEHRLKDAWQMWQTNTPGLLTGVSAIFPLTQIWQTRMAIRGITTHTIDCAIRFNTYAIAEEALRQGISPESITNQITVSRAFTPYQILDAVGGIRPGEICFVLAPAKQFFDGDVAFDEGVFLLQKLSRLFTEMNQRGARLFIIEKTSYPHAAFTAFLRDIREIAGGGWLLERNNEKHRLKILQEVKRHAA